MNSPSRLLAIALAAPLTVLNAWAFSKIFGYFQSLFIILLTSSLLAFLLNYPVRWFEKRGLKQGQAAVLVFLAAILLVLGLGVTLLPLALTQAQQLIARLPEWLDSGRQQLLTLDDRVNAIGLPINLDGLAEQLNAQLIRELQLITRQALNLTLSLTVFTVVRILDVLLTIVLTFYLVQNSQTIWRSLIQWLPTQVQTPFSQTLQSSFQNYFFGQVISATCMGLGLTSVFVLLKVPFGLLFGLTIGFMALVPFGGSVGIAIVTLLIALQNFGLAFQVLAVALIVQQIVENLIAPRVLGTVTGLNPFWIFVSILAGARVGGLLGIVLSVPLAVVIKEALIVARSTHHSDGGSDGSFYPAPHATLETTPSSDEVKRLQSPVVTGSE
ncbi:MAG: AI-2E family transporter [Oculatellaceae cyanobacterium bins.114]|nr:AI-2E family transporter [Oculatellaceae cyanobacterium bins.114]